MVNPKFGLVLRNELQNLAGAKTIAATSERRSVRTIMTTRPKKSAEPSRISKFFGELANRTSIAAGPATTYLLAVGIVIVWTTPWKG